MEGESGDKAYEINSLSHSRQTHLFITDSKHAKYKPTQTQKYTQITKQTHR